MFGSIGKFRKSGSESSILSENVATNNTNIPKKKISKFASNEIHVNLTKIEEHEEADIPLTHGKFATAKLSYEEEQMAKKLIAKDNTTTIACGRIKFEGVVVTVDAPLELVCEECEKHLSVLKCEACNQVFCSQCADLCHPREDMGKKLHPHEAFDFIRSIRLGDTSSKTINRGMLCVRVSLSLCLSVCVCLFVCLCQ